MELLLKLILVLILLIVAMRNQFVAIILIVIAVFSIFKGEESYAPILSVEPLPEPEDVVGDALDGYENLHESYFSTSPGNADDALTLAQQEYGTKAKRAVHGARELTQDRFAQMFNEELAENEARVWWSYEAQPY